VLLLLFLFVVTVSEDRMIDAAELFLLLLFPSLFLVINWLSDCKVSGGGGSGGARCACGW
jgi:hypothetical protein